MPKVASSRARTVAAPKKPAAKPKAKATEKKVAPKSTGWTAKGGTKKTTVAESRRTVGGRGSDVSTRDSRERIANMYVGGRGSDNSTADSRRRIADIYAGGSGSGSSYNSGGRGS